MKKLVGLFSAMFFVAVFSVNAQTAATSFDANAILSGKQEVKKECTKGEQAKGCCSKTAATTGTSCTKSASTAVAGKAEAKSCNKSAAGTTCTKSASTAVAGSAAPTCSKSSSTAVAGKADAKGCCSKKAESKKD
jgi:hypothetical protein